MGANTYYYCGVGITLSKPVTETKTVEVKTRKDSTGNSYPEDILYSPKTGELLETTIEYKKISSEVEFNHWDYFDSFGNDELFFAPEWWGNEMPDKKPYQILLLPNMNVDIEEFSLTCGIYSSIVIEDMIYKFECKFSKELNGLKKYFDEIDVSFIYTDYSF